MLFDVVGCRCMPLDVVRCYCMLLDVVGYSSTTTPLHNPFCGSRTNPMYTKGSKKQMQTLGPIFHTRVWCKPAAAFAKSHAPHHPTMLCCSAAHCAAAVEKLWVQVSFFFLSFFVILCTIQQCYVVLLLIVLLLSKSCGCKFHNLLCCPVMLQFPNFARKVSVLAYGYVVQSCT